MEDNKDEFYPNTNIKKRYCKNPKCHKLLSMNSKSDYCENCKRERAKRFRSLSGILSTVFFAVVLLIKKFGIKIWELFKR